MRIAVSRSFSQGVNMGRFWCFLLREDIVGMNSSFTDEITGTSVSIFQFNQLLHQNFCLLAFAENISFLVSVLSHILNGTKRYRPVFIYIYPCAEIVGAWNKQ